MVTPSPFVEGTPGCVHSGTLVPSRRDACALSAGRLCPLEGTRVPLRRATCALSGSSGAGLFAGSAQRLAESFGGGENGRRMHPTGLAAHPLERT